MGGNYTGPLISFIIRIHHIHITYKWNLSFTQSHPFDDFSAGSIHRMSKCWAVVRKGASWLWWASHRQKQLLGEGLETKLNRCLSTADLVLIGLGHMMGAGIYIITGEVSVTC